MFRNMPKLWNAQDTRVNIIKPLLDYIIIHRCFNMNHTDNKKGKILQPIEQIKILVFSSYTELS